jgi:hypothetical protein
MLPLKGTPADSNKIVTKQDVLDNFYVDLNAEPFASYTVNRCPRYEDLINPCSYGFGINNVTINCTSYSGATVSTAIASTTGYYQIALVNATTFALITAWQYYAGAPNPATVFTFTNVPNGNFKIALEASNSPSYCRVYSNTYTVDCATTLSLVKSGPSTINYPAFFEYYILVKTSQGNTGNSPGQTIIIEDQLDNLKLSMFALLYVNYNGVNVTGDSSYCTIINNNSPTGYFKIELLKPVDTTTNSYIIALQAFTSISNGTVDNTAYSYFPAPFSPVTLSNKVTLTITCTLENYYQLSSCSGGATAYTKVVPSGGGQRYVLFSTFPYSYYTYTGAILQLCEPPSGYNSNIQIVSGQTGCP